MSEIYLRTNKNIFINKNGKQLTNSSKIKLIRSYSIPPAWTNVVIDFKNPEIFATGIDKKGLKQYKYTTSHNERVKKQKFCNLIYLGNNLNKIQHKINYYLKKEDYNDINFYISVIIKIILICNFRIGLDDNVKKYNSYGISTIEKKHIKINANELKIEFNGKKGVYNSCIINDELIQSIMKKLYKQRKNTVFIIDDKRIGIQEVNHFLQQFDEHITSKNFRTWNANCITIEQLLPLHKKVRDLSQNQRKKILNEKIKYTAHQLHHTVNVCKKEYLVMDLYTLFIEHPQEFYKLGNNKKDLFMHYLQQICI